VSWNRFAACDKAGFFFEPSRVLIFLSGSRVTSFVLQPRSDSSLQPSFNRYLVGVGVSGTNDEYLIIFRNESKSYFVVLQNDFQFSVA